MAIDRIGQWGGLQSNYRMPEIKKAEMIPQPEQNKEQTNVSPVSNLQEEQKAESLQNRYNKNTPIEDISLTFQKKDDFDYLGKDSQIENLDVQKAISDMKKDQVLEEYQYFVGSARNLMSSFESEDGIVIPKF